MEYQLGILADFRDKVTENAYLKQETKKSLRFIRYVALLSSIANLLFGVMDIFFLTWTKEVLFLDFAVRIVNVIIAVCLFFVFNKSKFNKTTGIYFGGYAVILYGSHLFVASHFIPVNILFETFAVVLLTPCIFLIPNKWVTNYIFTLIILFLHITAMPYLCTEAVNGDRIITIAFLIWNSSILSILFYRINIHKRNHFAKELQLEELVKTDYLTKIHNRKACDEILEALKCTPSPGQYERF